MPSSLNDSYPLSQITTPGGRIVTLLSLYNASQKNGIRVLVTAASISLFAVLFVLAVLAISAYKTLRTPCKHRLMRTHVVAYFISLLICDVISSVGSLMNGHWISQGGVFLGTFCTSQGALKNTGNVGTALWSMVIAIHTFCLLVLKWRSRDYAFYATLFVVWLFIGLVVIVGPAAVEDMGTNGPYFGVSGYWCWITDGYTAQRVTLEYFWMFLSAFVSFLLYTVVFLSLRGNLIISGIKVRLGSRRSNYVEEARAGSDSPDAQSVSIAKQMLVYPIAYTALILPIALCRFLHWKGHNIPFEVTIFADAVFLLSGLVNAILFTATRKIVPTPQTRGFFSRSKSPKSDLESQSPKSTTPLVTRFIPADKVFVSPIEVEQEILVVPVSVPVPVMQKSHDKTIRGASFGPSVESIYSHTTAHESYVLPLHTPEAETQLKFDGRVIRQSVITPSLRRTSVDVPVGVTEEREVEVSRSYASSFYSTNIMGTSHFLSSISLPTPPPHSKSVSSLSSIRSYRAPGNRF